MKTPRYHLNERKNSSVRSISAKSRFMPELSTDEYIDKLVKEGRLDKKTASHIKDVRTAEAFRKYVTENDLGFAYMGR